MNYWTLSIAQLVVFLIAFLIPLYLCLPKAVSFYLLWKKTGKSIYLSASAASAVAGFFLLAAGFLMFIKAFTG
ncbi:MAG: hypothetical protein Q8L98_02830 [Chlamydiales bacterium]|nr:hypothetical protein [Chlamydiales bacterium]